jgi:hypothetical protein
MLDFTYSFMVSPTGAVLMYLISQTFSLVMVLVLLYLARQTGQLIRTADRIRELQELHIKMTGEIIDQMKKMKTDNTRNHPQITQMNAD